MYRTAQIFVGRTAPTSRINEVDMDGIYSKAHTKKDDSLLSSILEKKTVGNRWAVILAGGDGSRLLPLTRTLTGDERPKQFCKIIGEGTLLEVTRRRVEHVLPAAKTLVVLNEKHKRYYGKLISGIPDNNLIVQPKNIGTAPAILYSLLHLEKLDPNAVVAFFPSDHYFSDEAAFMFDVELAFDAAELNPNTVILMGIKPEAPDEEYGWIEPDFTSPFDAVSEVWPVSRFWEKPERALAVDLMEQGCLWNSFVMVGKASGFVRMIRLAAPMLFQRFEIVRPDIQTAREKDAIGRLYASELDTNFSTRILMRRPSDLAVIPVGSSAWSDLGSPERVASTLSDIGRRWMKDPAPAVNFRRSPKTIYETTKSRNNYAV